jgi:hypothetical protein
MKRLNPETNLPFRKGDVREDGMVFSNYAKWRPVTKKGFYVELWLNKDSYVKQKNQIRDWGRNLRSTKQGQVSELVRRVKSRCKKKNIPFNLTEDYLLDLVVDVCPALKIPLKWGLILNGLQPDTPSLDRVIPDLGYVKGNVQLLSHKANSMKNNATNEELHRFADWVKSAVPLTK